MCPSSSVIDAVPILATLTGPSPRMVPSELTGRAEYSKLNSPIQIDVALAAHRPSLEHLRVHRCRLETVVDVRQRLGRWSRR